MLNPEQRVSMSQSQYLRSECTIDYITTELTTSDAELLATFLARANCVITLDDLTQVLWPDDDVLPEWEHREITERIRTLKDRHNLTGLVQLGDDRWMFRQPDPQIH
jgi:DNA-binding winged helix-turn-helix (wHTH) protein